MHSLCNINISKGDICLVWCPAVIAGRKVLTRTTMEMLTASGRLQRPNESATETILLYIFYCVSCIAGRNILQRYMRKMKRSWCQKIFWLHGAQSLRIKTSGKPSIVQAHLVLATGEVQVIEYNSVQIHTIPRQNQAYRVDVYLYWSTIPILYRNLNSFLRSELQYL